MLRSTTAAGIDSRPFLHSNDWYDRSDVKYAERWRQAQKDRLQHLVHEVLPAGDLPGSGVGVTWSPSFTMG
jgi:hypothetical protein